MCWRKKKWWGKRNGKPAHLLRSGTWYSPLHLLLCLKQTLRAATKSDGKHVSSTRLAERSELTFWEIGELSLCRCWKVEATANPQGVTKKSLCSRRWEAELQSGLLWTRQNCFWAEHPSTALGTHTHLLPESISVSFVFPASQQGLWLCWECSQLSGTRCLSAALFKPQQLRGWAAFVPPELI